VGRRQRPFDGSVRDASGMRLSLRRLRVPRPVLHRVARRHRIRQPHGRSRGASTGLADGGSCDPQPAVLLDYDCLVDSVRAGFEPASTGFHRLLFQVSFRTEAFRESNPRNHDALPMHGAMTAYAAATNRRFGDSAPARHRNLDPWVIATSTGFLLRGACQWRVQDCGGSFKILIVMGKIEIYGVVNDLW
jgi:hypothetical protein